jgi:hypothetical protein
MELKTIEIQKATKRAYYYKNREKSLVRMANYNALNKSELSLKRKEKYALNRKVILERNKKWRLNNEEKYLECKTNEYNRNREKYSEYRKGYLKRKLKEDSYFKFVHSLRSRLRIAIKKRYKIGSAVRDLGCSGEEAYQYIQSLFVE